MPASSLPDQPKLSIVLPAYRLGDVIAGNLRRVLTAIDTSWLDAEVVVVNDGSPDDTRQQIEQVAAEDVRVSSVHHNVNRGKGEALVSGWKAARGEIVVFLDADLDLPPEQIEDLIPHLDDADLVVGAKRQAMGGGAYPMLRRLLSKVFAGLTTGLFRLPIEETQTGLKAFRREVLDKVLPQVRIRGYAFDLELVVRAHRAGFRVVEAPVSLGTGAASSSLRPSMMWNLGVDTFRLWWWMLRER